MKLPEEAGTVLKVFDPNLINLTCLAYRLQHVTKEVRAKLSQVNKLISITKKGVSESLTSSAIL
jgi:hypothetical protein